MENFSKSTWKSAQRKERMEERIRKFRCCFFKTILYLILFAILILFSLAIKELISLSTKEEQIKNPVKIEEKNITIIKVLNVVDQKIYIAADKACQNKGLGKNCVNDLRSIAATETNGTMNCNAVGDGGSAIGCFQINFYWPRTISKIQAKDIDVAVNWTLDTLIQNGYKTNRDVAIRKHNGSPTNPKTLNYLNKVNHWKTVIES